MRFGYSVETCAFFGSGRGLVGRRFAFWPLSPFWTQNAPNFHFLRPTRVPEMQFLIFSTDNFSRFFKIRDLFGPSYRFWSHLERKIPFRETARQLPRPPKLAPQEDFRGVVGQKSALRLRSRLLSMRSWWKCRLCPAESGLVQDGGRGFNKGVAFSNPAISRTHMEHGGGSTRAVGELDRSLSVHEEEKQFAFHAYVIPEQRQEFFRVFLHRTRQSSHGNRCALPSRQSADSFTTSTSCSRSFLTALLASL